MNGHLFAVVGVVVLDFIILGTAGKPPKEIKSS
ncbi:uncharacterized protein METZ01_LOCUS460988 [marine metagenome]|uniref:Uncharacterized protein n=1 Tax=marine metagenome TaxID=408172 RepID=A0A383AKC9_9ZZZZ